MIYTTLLLIGLLGLVAQAFLGFSHGGHNGARGGHANTGHANTGHANTGHAHAGHAARGGPRGTSRTERGPSPLWSWLSPLTIFSLCLGAGATGLLTRPAHWPSLLTALAALLGGLLFYGGIVRPLWSLIFKFASRPSDALNGMVAHQAEALGHFDGSGRGLVGLSIDGQWVRVLATLETDEDAGAVQKGDTLTVVSVDGRANTCRVARL